MRPRLSEGAAVSDRNLCSRLSTQPANNNTKPGRYCLTQCSYHCLDQHTINRHLWHFRGFPCYLRAHVWANGWHWPCCIGLSENQVQCNQILVKHRIIFPYPFIPEHLPLIVVPLQFDAVQSAPREQPTFILFWILLLTFSWLNTCEAGMVFNGAQIYVQTHCRKKTSTLSSCYLTIALSCHPSLAHLSLWCGDGVIAAQTMYFA